MRKICCKCKHQGEEDDCPDCRTRMGEIVYQDPDEIIMKNPDIVFPKPPNTELVAFGIHIGCSRGTGIINTGRTTSGKTVYICRDCFLRVVEKE